MDAESILEVSEGCDLLAAMVAEVVGRRFPEMDREQAQRFASQEIFDAARMAGMALVDLMSGAVLSVEDADDPEFAALVREAIAEYDAGDWSRTVHGEGDHDNG